MASLPAIYPEDLVKILTKQGFVIARQKGSHVRLIHSDGRSATVSIHNKPLPVGTLLAILRQVKISSNKLREGLH